MGYYKLPYHDRRARFQVPDKFDVTEISPPTPLSAEEQDKLIKDRIDDRPLMYLLKKKVKILVVTPAWNSQFPFAKILEPLLKNIEDNREKHSSVMLVVAGGHGGPKNRDEVKEAWGLELPRQVQVVLHRTDTRDNIYLGEASVDVPIYLNQNLFYSDCVITVDAVNLNLWGGYSGGWQTIAQHCSSNLTAIPMLRQLPSDSEGCAIGRTRGNPYHRIAKQVASIINIQYAVQAVLDSEGGILKLLAGEISQAYFGAVKQADALFRRKITTQADLGIVGVSTPQSKTLFDAVPAICSAALTEHEPLKPGAPLLCPLYLEDGLGEKQEHKEFNTLLAMGPEKALQTYNEDPSKYGIGGNRAALLARLLLKNPLILIACSIANDLSEYGIHFVKTMPEALRKAATLRKEQDDIQSIMLLEDPAQAYPASKEPPPPTHRRDHRGRGRGRGRRSPDEKVQVVQAMDADEKMISTATYSDDNGQDTSAPVKQSATTDKPAAKPATSRARKVNTRRPRKEATTTKAPEKVESKTVATVTEAAPPIEETEPVKKKMRGRGMRRPKKKLYGSSPSRRRES